MPERAPWPAGLWRFDYRTVGLVVGILVITALTLRGRHVLSGDWRTAKGYEFEWIAYPLSEGFGYTFADTNRWLGPYSDPNGPTAWVEPVQTAIMALAFNWFGEYGRLVLVVLNYVWFAASCLIVFELGRRLAGLPAGAFSAVALAAFGPGKRELIHYIGNSALATVLICAVTLVIVLVLERPSHWRYGALGLLLGTLVLTLAGAILFIPFVAFIVMVNGHGIPPARRLARGGVVFAVAAAVMLPWTVRNWLAFGEFVPVRTGLGQNMHYALPGLAQTIHPDLDLGQQWSAPPWTAKTPGDAVKKALDTDSWISLVNHSLQAGRAYGGESYSSLNEAQRDALLSEESLAFIRNYPGLTADLFRAKLTAFFWDNWRGFRVVTLMALIGAGLALRRRNAWPVVALILLYAIPYLLAAPLYYRYRAPIEPLLFVLGGLPVGFLLGHITKAHQMGAPARGNDGRAANFSSLLQSIEATNLPQLGNGGPSHSPVEAHPPATTARPRSP